LKPFGFPRFWIDQCLDYRNAITIHGGYRYRSMWTTTRTQLCDNYDSDGVLMAKTVRGELLGIKMSAVLTHLLF
jgi:hypothetical protein